MTQLYGIRPPVTGNPTAPIQPLEGTGIQNVQGNVEQPQEQPVQQSVPNARTLTQKLDSLLFKVAQVSTRSVNRTNLKNTLVNTQIPGSMQKKLNHAANQAFETFSSLSKFTGKQIADALVVDKDGNFDWANNDASKVLKKVLDDQKELAGLLHDVVNDYNLTSDAFETLSEMALTADRRQSEIMTLALELASVKESSDDPKTHAHDGLPYVNHFMS